MEPTVVLVLVAAALAALIARGRRLAPQREPVAVRIEDDSQQIVRRR
jgi:hypothetical protein